MIVVSLNGNAREIRYVPPALRSESPDSERANLMCKPVAQGPPDFPAERYPCGNQACRLPVWVSNNTTPRAYREDWSILCIPCSLLAHKLDGAPGGPRVLEEQRAALREVGLTDANIDQVLALANAAFEAGEMP